MADSPFNVILIKAADQLPRTDWKHQFQRLLLGAAWYEIPFTLSSYWYNQSYTLLNLEGSQIFGFFDVVSTASEAAGWDRKAMIEQARAIIYFQKLNISPFQLIVGSLVGGNDGGSWELAIGAKLDDSTGKPPDHAWLCHEMGHCLSLVHSCDLSPTSHDPNDDQTPGAYGDPEDIMSYAVTTQSYDSPFGVAGPGLNAANRWVQGWMGNRSMFIDVGTDPVAVDVVTIPPINDYLVPADASRPQAVVLQYAPNLKLFISYLTKTNWYAGIVGKVPDAAGGGGVVVHLLRQEPDKPGDPKAALVYRSYIVSDYLKGGDPFHITAPGMAREFVMDVLSTDPGGAEVRFNA